MLRFVQVGSSVCSPTTHGAGVLAHQQLTCKLTQGVGIGVPLLVLQSGSSISNNTLSVSYAPCPPGTYQANDTDYACTGCPVGTYTDVSGQASTARAVDERLLTQGLHSTRVSPARQVGVPPVLVWRAGVPTSLRRHIPEPDGAVDLQCLRGGLLQRGHGPRRPQLLPGLPARQTLAVLAS
jgi:hypothetical protein